MEIKGLTQEYRMQQWAGFISGRNGSGKTVKVWCEEQGVNQKRNYYWQQKIQEALSERITTGEGQMGLPSWKEPEVFQLAPVLRKSRPRGDWVRIGWRL